MAFQEEAAFQTVQKDDAKTLLGWGIQWSMKIYEVGGERTLAGVVSS